MQREVCAAPDYKAMYFELFRASVQAAQLLQDAQSHRAEQHLLEELDPPPIRLERGKQSRRMKKQPKDLTERVSPLKKKASAARIVDFLRAQTNVQMLFTLCAIVLCNNFFLLKKSDSFQQFPLSFQHRLRKKRKTNVEKRFYD